MPFDQGGLEILGAEVCLSLLATAPLGRIVFTDRALPAVQPVNYLMVDGDVVIRVSRASRLATATRDTIVAFEIDGFDTDARSGWSVVMIGRARAVTDPAELAVLSTLPLHPWAPGARDHYIRIRPRLISGRRTPDAEQAAPQAEQNGRSRPSRQV